MSIGSLATLGSAAGVQMAQSKGSDVERAAGDATNQQRQVSAEKSANQAASISQPDGEQHGANDRDADGRRIWERSSKAKPAAEQSSDEQASDEIDTAPPLSKDVTGETGNTLDLLG